MGSGAATSSYPQGLEVVNAESPRRPAYAGLRNRERKLRAYGIGRIAIAAPTALV